MAKIKTRSPLYLKNISDEVNEKLNVKASELNIAKWLLVEKVLEDYLGIKNTDSIDVTQFVGTNRTNIRTGKPYNKKLSK